MCLSLCSSELVTLLPPALLAALVPHMSTHCRVLLASSKITKDHYQRTGQEVSSLDCSFMTQHIHYTTVQ